MKQQQSGQKSQSITKKISQSFQALIHPKSKAEKEKRLQQFRDISIFAVSIGLFITFEKQIREFFTIDYNELKKMMAPPS